MSQHTPLTQANFDALRRDKTWQMSEVYLDTFEAAHDPLGEKVPGERSKVHYLIKRTGRSDFPYLLYGPFVGEVSKSPWPSKKDVEAFFEQNERRLVSEGGKGNA
jgi:hypothetical protein